MKRTLDHPYNTTEKRARGDYGAPPEGGRFDPHLHRDVSEVLEHGADGRGFIVGRVCIPGLWMHSRSKAAKWNLILKCQSTTGGCTYMIHIAFSGPRHHAGTRLPGPALLGTGDRISLSLEGAVEDRQELLDVSIHLRLTFNEGIVFHHIAKTADASVGNEVKDDALKSAPFRALACDPNSPSLYTHPLQDPSRLPSLPFAALHASELPNFDSASPTRGEAGKSSKTQKKKLKKERKRARQAGVTQVAASSAPQPVPAPLPQNTTIPAKAIEHPILPENGFAAPAAGPSSRPIAKAEANVRDLRFGKEVGIVHQMAQPARYPQLGQLGGLVGKFVDIIGVVAWVNGEKPINESGLGTDKWSKYLGLIDESNFEAVDVGSLGRGSAGFAVTCFTPENSEFLPRVKKGDVVLLSQIHIREWGGKIKGNGYANKLQWAIFGPESRSFIDGSTRLPKSMPKQVSIGKNQTGYAQSPFWTPAKSADSAKEEITRCVLLKPWWEAVTEEIEKAKGVIHCIGDATNASTDVGERRGGRQQLLIKDASPNMWPQGFFDCTVEVLFVQHNPRPQPCTVYVTDYTKVTRGTAIRDSDTWCLAELRHCVLRIETWDSSRAVGESLHGGDFVAFNNTKMVVSRDGYVEAKCQEGRKIEKLDGAKANQIPALDGLLKRRNGFLERNRKLEWQDAVEQGTTTLMDDRSLGPNPVAKASNNPGITLAADPSTPLVKWPRPWLITMKGAESLPCPSKFRLDHVRVVDFYPAKLEDCVSRQCINCDRILEKAWKICPECMKIGTAAVCPIFVFFLRVVDSEGSAMEVLVNSHQKCTLLDGLETNFIDDRAALGAFKDRMAPMIGNLEEIHERLGELTCPELEKIAWLNLNLQCWLYEDEAAGVEFRVYEFAGHAIVS